MTQDELWKKMWRAYKRFLEKNKRRPSKYYAKERVLYNWFKHSRKLLNQDKMKDDRIERFKLLLDEAKDYQRINQHQYVNGEVYTK